MEDQIYYLVLTSLHIVTWCVFYALFQRKVDAFDPFYLISALYIMIFVFGPWVWIDRGQTTYQGVQVMAYLPQATKVFNIGYACFAVGSISRHYMRVTFGGRGLSNRQKTQIDIDYTDEETRRYIVKYAVLVYIGSMALSLLYYQLIGRSILSLLSLGQMGETTEGRAGEGIYFLKTFFRSAIPGAILLLSFSKKKFVPWICTIVLSIMCISTGSRNLAITVMLSVFIYHYMRRKKRPSIVTLSVLIVGFYVLIGVIGIFRSEIKGSQEIDFSQVDSEGMFEAFMFNAEIFYPFYNLVEFIPQNAPYHYGLGILNIVVQFVPRILWPGKPTMLGETAFEVMYGDSMGGAAYPNIGEFYYEFGLAGVIVMMFLYGRIMTGVYRNALKQEDRLSIIMFAINFGYIIQFVCRGHFASWAIDYVFMLGPVVLLQWLLRNKRDSARALSK